MRTLENLEIEQKILKERAKFHQQTVKMLKQMIGKNRKLINIMKN